MNGISKIKYFYNKDHLGSIRQKVKNRENNIVSARDYYAYGSVLRDKYPGWSPYKYCMGDPMKSM